MFEVRSPFLLVNTTLGNFRTGHNIMLVTFLLENLYSSQFHRITNFFKYYDDVCLAIGT